MNFYNINKSLGLSSVTDIDNNQKWDEENFIFILDEKSENLKLNYLIPNFRRKLCSYIVFDYNNNLYNASKQILVESGYNVTRYDLNKSYNMLQNKFDNSIKNIVSAILKNSKKVITEIRKNYKTYNDLYKNLEDILYLVLSYIFNKFPKEKQTMLNVKKIINKLNGNSLEYFKKIFYSDKISIELRDKCYSPQYFKEEKYKFYISLVYNALCEIPNEIYVNEIIPKDLKIFNCYNNLTAIFVECTNSRVVNSQFCNDLARTLRNDLDNRENMRVPIMLMYSSMEKIGYIESLLNYKDWNFRNKVLITIHTNNLYKLLYLYQAVMNKISNGIQYGIIYNTQNEKNIKYLPKFIRYKEIEDMIEKINVNPNYCIIYRKATSTTLEKILVEEQPKAIENDRNDETLSEDANKDENNSKILNDLNKEFAELDTKEELLEHLKLDIESEKDSVKKKHFVELYNVFSTI